MQEEWRPVKGVGGRYEVSNLGRVRRVARVLVTSSTTEGHRHVTMGTHRRAYVHRLVAEAFLAPDREDRIWVNHKNGDPTDNRAENLEWCTPRENVAHGYALGRARGRRQYNAIPVAKYTLGGELLAKYDSVRDAAEAEGVSAGAIHSAMRRHGTCLGARWVKL